jgi:hypothetical protein
MLNLDHFVLLAGDPTKWDIEMIDRTRAGESLTDVQEDQHRRGRRGVVLRKFGKQYLLSAASNLTESAKAVKYEDRMNAISIGCAWAQRDPENREFFAPKGLAPNPDMTLDELMYHLGGTCPTADFQAPGFTSIVRRQGPGFLDDYEPKTALQKRLVECARPLFGDYTDEQHRAFRAALHNVYLVDLEFTVEQLRDFFPDLEA